MNNVDMFKCPVCRRLHPMSEGDLIDDLHCTDNETSELKLIRGMDNKDSLMANNWNFNKFSTRVSEFTNNLKLEEISRNNPHPRRVRNW